MNLKSPITMAIVAGVLVVVAAVVAWSSGLVGGGRGPQGPPPSKLRMIEAERTGTTPAPIGNRNEPPGIEQMRHAAGMSNANALPPPQRLTKPGQNAQPSAPATTGQ